MYYALEKPYKEKGNPSEYDFFFLIFLSGEEWWCRLQTGYLDLDRILALGKLWRCKSQPAQLMQQYFRMQGGRLKQLY